MSIGSTSGKEPDHIEDGDLRTPDELRGDMRAIAAAKLSLAEKATVEGISVEIQVLKQQLEMTHEQMRSLIHIYATLRDQFNAFNEQRIKELNVRVNGGSTTPEDME